jgi:spore coat polysaccharide biosynthesis protein SpsF (cytidylyltransferase family)
MKNVAIVSARMESERFPGKVMSNLWKDLSSLEVLITRLKLSKRIDEIIIVTTPDERNKPIYDLCLNKDVFCCAGHPEEALQSVLYACKESKFYKDEDDINIIDITGDCPFIDPFQIDQMLATFELNNYHYLSNCMIRSFPIGFDIQIYKAYLLFDIEKLIINKKHRIHSGWNIWTYSAQLQHFYKQKAFPIIKYGNVCAVEQYFYPDWRIVLDYKEDLLLLKHVMRFFDCLTFTHENVIDFLKERPDLLVLNRHCVQKIPGV